MKQMIVAALLAALVLMGVLPLLSPEDMRRGMFLYGSLTFTSMLLSIITLPNKKPPSKESKS